MVGSLASLNCVARVNLVSGWAIHVVNETQASPGTGPVVIQQMVEAQRLLNTVAMRQAGLGDESDFVGQTSLTTAKISHKAKRLRAFE